MRPMTEQRLCPRLLRRTALMLAVVLSALVPPALATDLPTILATSRVAPPARVAFLEERYNPLFERPLLLEGYLEYLGPGALRKVIQAPFDEAFSIADGAITMERDGESRRLPVRRSKSLETMLGAFEGVLSGDADMLASVFDYEVRGETSDWTIDLTPRSRRIAKQLSSLELRGNDAGVSQISIDLRDGERHIMYIRNEEPLK